MKVRHFLCACWVVATTIGALIPDLRAADRPNFVWLISEDNSTHYMKLYNATGATTPRIAELAEHGLQFQHAFSCAPVCSVARTTLITGCYAPRIGTQFHRRAVSVPMPKGLKMFPAYLRDAGYYTTNREKKDYNADESPGTWDESSKRATWRNRKKGQPFFHKQSFPTTHESSLHFSAESMADQRTNTDPSSVKLFPYHPETPTFRYTVARYHDQIQKMDTEIGTVVDQLREDGLLEDTFVFYFADHGGVLPRGKGYAYESGLHIPLVVRVPENFRHLVPWKLGTQVDGFVSHVDLGPTLWKLAGVDGPLQLIDGRAFLGKDVIAAEVDARQTAFGYADRFDEKYDLVRTLRDGDFKYVRSYQPFNFDGLHNNYRYQMLAYRNWRELFGKGQLNADQQQFFKPRQPEALYNLADDPHETRNLASDPAHTQRLLKLRSLMQQRVKSMPDLSFYPESHLAEVAFTAPVEFGQTHQVEIGELVDIADLSLLPFEQAEPLLRTALAVRQPWKRYWALIVCTAFGKAARPLAEQARSLATSDEDLLVRMRAAEFLGLTGEADPRPILGNCVQAARNPLELALMLNTVVLLRDGAGTDFDFSSMRISESFRQQDSVKRRWDYLTEKP